MDNLGYHELNTFFPLFKSHGIIVGLLPLSSHNFSQHWLGTRRGAVVAALHQGKEGENLSSSDIVVASSIWSPTSSSSAAAPPYRQLEERGNSSSQSKRGWIYHRNRHPPHLMWGRGVLALMVANSSDHTIASPRGPCPVVISSSITSYPYMDGFTATATLGCK